MAAEACAAAAEQRGTPKSQLRAKADAAAEEMAAQLGAARAAPSRPKPPVAVAETDRDTAVKQAGQDAASRIAAAQADRDAAVEQARAEARRRVAAGALAMPQHLDFARSLAT